MGQRIQARGFAIDRNQWRGAEGGEDTLELPRLGDQGRRVLLQHRNTGVERGTLLLRRRCRGGRRRVCLDEREEGRLMLPQEPEHLVGDGSLWRVIAQLIASNPELDVVPSKGVENLNGRHRKFSPL